MDKDEQISSLNQDINVRDEQLEDMQLKFRKKEIEGYKAQFQLSCQILHKDRVIAEKEKVIAEKDSVIAEKDSVIAEKDGVIAEKDRVIAERDLAIRKIFESRSMRLMKPVHNIAHQYRRVRSTMRLIISAVKL